MTNFLPAKMRPGHDCRTFDPRGLYNAGHVLTIDFLGSGSSGNATLIRWDSTALLVDCGFGPRVLRRRLEQAGVPLEALTAVLLTHEHGDHSAGLRGMTRLPGLSVFLTPRTADALPARGAGEWACTRVLIQPGQPFAVGPMTVLPFSTAHDAGQPVGFVISLPDHRRIGIATDLGHGNRETVEALRGCQLLCIEANHDPRLLRAGPYPAFLKRRIGSRRGHLSNADAAALLRQVASDQLQHLFAMHLSRTNNEPELARSMLQRQLRELGLGSAVKVTVVEQDSRVSYPAPGQLSLF